METSPKQRNITIQKFISGIEDLNYFYKIINYEEKE